MVVKPPNRTPKSLHVPNWPVELNDLTTRDIEWCFNFLNNSFSNISIRDKESYIIDFLNINKNRTWLLYDHYNHYIDFNLILELRHANIIDLSWVLPDDQRLLIWLLHLNIPTSIPINTMNNLHYNTNVFYSHVRYPSSQLPVEKRYSSIIEYIDSIRFNTTDAQPKEDFLNNIKNNWIQIKTPESMTNWIDQENETQLLWGWEYLINHGKAANVLPPANKKEYYISIIASLDAFHNLSRHSRDSQNHINFAERELFINKFIKAWSQKKFRDGGKHKKDYHLPLTKKSKYSLEKLSKVLNKSESEILEELINKMFIETCMDINGNEIY